MILLVRVHILPQLNWVPNMNDWSYNNNEEEAEKLRVKAEKERAEAERLEKERLEKEKEAEKAPVIIKPAASSPPAGRPGGGLNVPKKTDAGVVIPSTPSGEAAAKKINKRLGDLFKK